MNNKRMTTHYPCTITQPPTMARFKPYVGVMNHSQEDNSSKRHAIEKAIPIQKQPKTDYEERDHCWFEQLPSSTACTTKGDKA